MSGLLSWIGRNARRLDFSLTEITAHQKCLPDYHDFAAKITMRGEDFHGRGRGWTREDAVRKACGEALERAVSVFMRDELDENTNGWALGIDEEMASTGAVRELIERDAFLCHYYTQTSFFEGRQAENSRFWPLLSFCESKGVDIRVGRMETLDGRSAYCAAAFGEKFTPAFGVIVGLGCHVAEEEALDKALAECMTSTLAFLEAPESPFILSEFEAITKPAVSDQGKLALSMESLRFVRPLFELRKKRSEKVASFPQVTIERIPLPDELQGAPLVVCRARSPQVQPLRFGVTRDLNWKRLRDFHGGKDVVVPRFPHPLA